MASIEFVLPSPVGNLAACLDGEALVNLSYTGKPATRLPRSQAARDLVSQLRHYFYQDAKHRFAIKLKLQGTTFQKRVWRVLQTIPCGSFLRYGDIAERLRSGPRAVGNACGRNPISIVVPCHRVLASHGLGGYSGSGAAIEPLHIKAWLLGHEGAILHKA